MTSATRAADRLRVGIHFWLAEALARILGNSGRSPVPARHCRLIVAAPGMTAAGGGAESARRGAARMVSVDALPIFVEQAEDRRSSTRAGQTRVRTSY